MSAIPVSGTVLKGFQQRAVDAGTRAFNACLGKLSRAGRRLTEEARRAIIADAGALLIEAPTGTGKTLMAGHIVANVSEANSVRASTMPIVWFWFAPFTGLVDQAERTIRAELGGLRPRSIATDRDHAALRSGDVYVTTWASVAVANEASRKARSASESAPSLDDLVAQARLNGYAIGVVIDEAHHSFRGRSQALAFYREVLDPEITILATATPRDKDVEAFAKEAGMGQMRRCTVSRKDGIQAGLIKQGIKSVVFKAPADVAGLIDFKKTALKQGVATHNAIKKQLEEAGHSVVPLLLVQVDSTPGAVEEAVGWLKEFGFRTEGRSRLVRSHTAAEPDPLLSTIAADEDVEALVFKMAVAIGFDAPRAFVLVSFRSSRDEDFGIQIVGRIMRVDRRLQATKGLPPALTYGYAFLSNIESQAGLLGAAQRINAVKTELSSVSSRVDVIAIGDSNEVVGLDKNGQATLLGALVPDTSALESARGDADDDEDVAAEPAPFEDPEIQPVLGELFELLPQESPKRAPDSTSPGPARPGQVEYPLRAAALGAPAAFKRATVSLDHESMLKDVVARFRFDAEAFVAAQRSAASIVMEEIDIFLNRKDKTEQVQADLAKREIDATAQRCLFRANDDGMLSVQDLHARLVSQFKLEAERQGLGKLYDTDEKAIEGLHKVLALRPEQLKKAVSETVASHVASEDADPIEAVFVSDEPLDAARLNIYGVFPPDLNSWERKFAEELDNDTSGTVLWWHRNPVRRPFSVSLPLPGQPDFYPDFVVGVKDRVRGHGILLAETKRVINDEEGNAAAKAEAKHPDYGKVLMAYLEEGGAWRVVEYDPKTDKNFLDRALRVDILPSY